MTPSSLHQSQPDAPDSVAWERTLVNGAFAALGETLRVRLVVAGALCFAMGWVVSWPRLVGWAVLFAVAMGGSVSAWRDWTLRGDELSVAVWRRCFENAAVFTGLAWGVAGWRLFPSG